MILKNLSFIQSCNFNITDFLKLRKFYDLVLLDRRPQNHKNKNVEEKLLVPQGKWSFPPSSNFWEIRFPPAERRGGGGGGVLCCYYERLYLCGADTKLHAADNLPRVLTSVFIIHTRDMIIMTGVTILLRVTNDIYYFSFVNSPWNQN